MKKINTKRLAVTLVGILTFSCQKEFTSDLKTEITTSTEETMDQIPRLQNPYSVKNMRIAMESLVNKIFADMVLHRRGNRY